VFTQASATHVRAHLQLAPEQSYLELQEVAQTTTLANIFQVSSVPSCL
jgi:hypothetical protein